MGSAISKNKVVETFSTWDNDERAVACLPLARCLLGAADRCRRGFRHVQAEDQPRHAVVSVVNDAELQEA